jgi:hypothetical protein
MSALHDLVDYGCLDLGHHSTFGMLHNWKVWSMWPRKAKDDLHFGLLQLLHVNSDS